MSFCSWFGGEKYRDHFENGIYVCNACGHELFSSKVKYAHSTPWPAFSQPIHGDSLVKVKESDRAFKVRCGKCNHGLGHEFTKDGPREGSSRF